MKIVLIQDHQKKIFEKKIAPLERHLGLISLEKIEGSSEFTLRLLGVDHLRYRYSPRTRKFEIHFLSLRKQGKERRRSHGTPKSAV